MFCKGRYPLILGNVKLTLMVFLSVIWGPAAFGCVMHDSQRNIIGVKGGPIGVCGTIHTKTMSLLEGLNLAKGKGATGCILEGDSLTVVSWGRGMKCGSWRLNHFFAEIKSLIKFLDAELVHVPQAQNSLADRIAKWSVGQSSCFVGDSLLPW